jgi:hypothetical protein
VKKTANYLRVSRRYVGRQDRRPLLGGGDDMDMKRITEVVVSGTRGSVKGRCLVVVSGLASAAMVLAGGHAVPALSDQIVLAAEIEQSAARPAWPDRAYRVEWADVHIPGEVVTRSKVAVPVTVRNVGNQVWPASEVFVSYHWFRDNQLVVWDGERTRLPRDLRTGSRAAASVHVATPTEPGSYVLMLTLVHELVTWFEHKGAVPIVQPVAVRLRTPDANCGVGDSTPCLSTR